MRCGIGMIVVGLLCAVAAGQTRPVEMDLSTPRGALKVFTTGIASGDVAKVRGVLSARGEAEEKLADVLAETAVAATNLRDSVRERYGEKALKRLDGAGAAGLYLSRIVQGAEKIEGDVATVTIGAGAPGSVQVCLVREGEAWKLPVTDMLGGEDTRNVSRLLPTMQNFARIMKQTAVEIREDKHKNVEEAEQTLRTRLRSAAALGSLDVPLRGPGTQPATMPSTRESQ